jgi:hypothetical protein
MHNHERRASTVKVKSAVLAGGLVIFAMTAAHGHYMVSGRPQVVLVHADLGPLRAERHQRQRDGRQSIGRSPQPRDRVRVSDIQLAADLSVGLLRVLLQKTQNTPIQIVQRDCLIF